MQFCFVVNLGMWYMTLSGKDMYSCVQNVYSYKKYLASLKYFFYYCAQTFIFMNKKFYAALLPMVLILGSFNANAQFGNLKSKALDKATGQSTPAYTPTAEDNKRTADRRKTPKGMSDMLLEPQMKEELKQVLVSAAGVNNAVAKTKILGSGKVDISYTITDFYIIDTGWTINKNDAGAAINRQLLTEAILKGSDGKCYLKQYYFTEKSQGNDKFGAVVFSKEQKPTNPNDTGELLCENAK